MSLGERLFRALTEASSYIILFLVIAIGYSLLLDSLPVFTKFGIWFLFSSEWDPVRQIFGALPAVIGTLETSVLALVMATPVAVGAALFVHEISPAPIMRLFSPIIDALASIPSVIYGLWGLFFLMPLLKEWVMRPLNEALGFIPLFSGSPQGPSILLASVILAIMILPTIASLTLEALKMVPRELVEGALALGATRWEAVRITILPHASESIKASMMLALARALGETMAVTMVIGNTYKLPVSLLEPGVTITSIIANSYTEATSELHISALLALGFILLLISVVVNVISRCLLGRVGHE